jgi:predicted AAA+ superfamily ATPase
LDFIPKTIDFSVLFGYTHSKEEWRCAMAMQRLERKEYLDKLIGFRDKQLIKVVTGVRRCGKSTLLEIYQDYLRANGVEEAQIVAINLEDFDFFSLREPAALHAYVKERLVPGKMTYVFIDEIQHCADFPAVVDSLYIRKNVDVYLTGSNAYMLSSEIATLISGRYIEIRMLPLSFREYVLSTGSEDNLAAKYREYIQGSSFPYALELKEKPSAVRDYLEGVYNTIVVKDIAARKKIADTMMLESVTRFVFDSIGSQLSTKKIADTMTSSGRKIDVKTVERYLEGLMESFIIYQAKRYNIRGKQYLKTLEKYYVVDIGMRYMLLGTSGTDVGHMLENIIYLELIRRGYEVYIGKIDELEVDFVARGQKGIRYIQVAASVRDEKTLTRQLASLQMIADNYPKVILTLDEDPEADYEGIRRINALDWLMGRASI